MSERSHLSTRSTPTPPPALSAKVRAAIAAEPAPSGTRMLPRLLVSALAAAIGSAIFGFRTRGDLASLPMGDLIGTLAALLMLAFAGWMLATYPGRRGLGTSIVVLWGVVLSLAPIYGAVVMAAPIHAPGASWPAEATSTIVSHAIPCAVASLVVACIALSGMLFALRRAVPVAPSLRGAALGAAAGAWAGLALHLHCVHFDRPHLLLGHVLPVAIFTLLGALIAPRVIKP